MQEIAYATAEIEKVCFGMYAAKSVFVTDVDLFHLVVYPWHKTFFMLVMTEIVVRFVILSDDRLIRSGSGEKQLAVVTLAYLELFLAEKIVSQFEERPRVF
jgi:hypothetical protein